MPHKNAHLHFFILTSSLIQINKIYTFSFLSHVVRYEIYKLELCVQIMI